MPDNEFYVVVFRDKEYGVSNHVFIHLINGESIKEKMKRIHNVNGDQIEQIYKRTYTKE